MTGGTGFVGARTLAAALAAGWQVRALTRRAQPDRSGVTWVPGALDDAAALAALVEGADAVLHIAGVVNAPDRAGFDAGNRAGTEAVVGAAIGAGVRRFVHVSSLAARLPALSNYGWSKAAAETVVAGSGLDWTMVRPPAIFGPGDADMLEIFKMARRGVMLMPPAGRAGLIFVDDLAALLIALAADDARTIGAIYEADDGRPRGWSHRAMARAIAAAVQRPHAVVAAMPAPLLRLAARADRLVRGPRARLTPDRASYMLHPDWTVDPARRPPAGIWRPQADTPTALAATWDWYRANGWA